MLKDLKNTIKSFPKAPGVYIMKDKKGFVIYVGKAKNLKARVRQYFSGSDTRAQISFLMKRVYKIDYLQTGTESEALLLENSLIKKHKPKYNVFLKDDKTYLGLKLTVKDDFPKLLTTRRKTKDGAEYFGPFTNSDSLRQVKEFIDTYFMLKTCSDSYFKARKRPCLEYQIKRCSAPCVGYVTNEEYKKQIQEVLLFLKGKDTQLKRLVAVRMKEAALNENFEEAARLRDLLNSMDVVLSTQKVVGLHFDFVDVIEIVRQDSQIGIAVLMVRASNLIDAKYYAFSSLEEDEDFLQNFMIQYYTERSFIPKEIILMCPLINQVVLEHILTERAGYKVKLSKPKKGIKKDLIQLAQTNLNSHLKKELNKQDNQNALLNNLQKKFFLKKQPSFIECYDVSNISGQYAVASLITFKNLEKFTQGYKKFKIKTIQGPNDFAMLKEVFKRRFKNQTKNKWPKPDMILVDGGKGQLKQIQTVLEELKIEGIDLVSIAKGQGQGVRAKGRWDEKKEEDFYIINRKNPIKLKNGSKELMLMQQIRDEAHRFAIEYHRQFRDKGLTQSVLDEIPGIGPKKKAFLIKTFGSVSGVLEASVDELLKVSGINDEIARLIKEARETR